MKVGIKGSGMVGATSAYAIMMCKAASDIVLIDANNKRAVAEAEDIQHTIPFVHATDVYTGSYDDLADAKIVVIAAGVSQKPGETLLMLMERNASILTQIISNVAKVNSNPLFLIATNPDRATAFYKTLYTLTCYLLSINLVSHVGFAQPGSSM